MSRLRINLCVTRQCNLACSYCYVPHTDRTLSKDVGLSLLDWLDANFDADFYDLILLGGEPLLKKQLLTELIEHWRCEAQRKNKDIFISTFTNGTLLNAENISWLTRHIDSIAVSLDGKRSIHNRYRVYKDGSPTYDEIMRNIPPLLQAHRRVGTITVITRELIPHLAETVAAVRAAGIKKIFYQPLFPPSEEWSDGDFAELFRQFEMIGKEWIASQTSFAPFQMLSWHGIFHALESGELYRRKCSDRYLFVAENGDVYHCHDMEIIATSPDANLPIPDANVLTPASPEWQRYWQHSSSHLCHECEATRALAGKPGIYNETIDRFYQTEYEFCKSILDRVRDRDWFTDFMQINA